MTNNSFRRLSGMAADTRSAATHDILAGGGEMGALMRAHDWAATVLGAPQAWPQPLRTTVRLLLTSRHPMFVFWGPSHTCFYNDSYRLTMGPERHPTALGQPGRQVWDEIWPVVGPQIEQVMSGGEATWHEEQLIPVTRHGQREDVWWTYGYSPIDDPTTPSGVGGVLVVCMDVTREHLGRKALLEAEERTRLALAAADGVGTWDWDVGADRVRADTRFARLYGVDPDRAARGAPLAEFTQSVDPRDQQWLGLAIARALETGEEFNAEYRILQEDGQVRWVAARGRCLRAADGSMARFPGVTTDITERKRAERRQAMLLALLESQRRTDDADAMMLAASEALGHHLGVERVGFFAVRDDAVLDFSTGWSTGRLPTLPGSFPVEDFDARALAELRAGRTLGIADTASDPRAAGSQFGAIGTAALIGAPIIRNGRWHAGLYIDHAEPRVWREDEISLVREVAEQTWDAVERARAIRAQNALNATLEQRVAERTAELENAEAALRQSQKMEAVGQLTGGLAHDFNNLLAGIAGNLELLQARMAQGRINDIERYVTAAQGAAKRAASLTHRLLAFSRQQTLDPKPTDVNRLVSGMVELIRRTIGPGIAMEPLVAAGGLWTTLVDPGQLENALLNLCINARDAMPDGGKLTIETGNRWLDPRAAREHDVPPGQYVSLCVSDSGSGMTDEVAARAFDPFFTTKPLGQGTGLGLSMIYGFARQSGGQVRIYSELGQGTMVCLYLPRHLGEAQTDEGPAEPTAARHAEQGETVLVVDDEPTVRMLVVEVLEDLGYTAVEAADSAAGQRVLQSETRIDLLVTDVGLPGGMNGRQLADVARATRPGLKVLFITGYAENAVLSHGHLQPGMHMLTKPFAMDTLASRIKSLITTH